jgi:hypothetical protein
MNEQRKTSRRELLTSVGRYAALVGLVGGVGALAARTACRRTVCGACPLLARCDLAKAEEARECGLEHGGRS